MDIGKTLKSQRVKSSISLEGVNRDTKISIIYLEALESNRFDKFPAEVYLIGNIKKYAEYLGLDSNLFINELKDQGVVKIAAQLRKPLNIIESPESDEQEFFVFSESFTRGVVLLLCIVLFLGSILAFFGWYSHRLYVVNTKKNDSLYSAYRFFKSQSNRGYNFPDKLDIYLKTQKRIWVQLKDSEKLFFEGFLPKNKDANFTSSNYFDIFVESPKSIVITLNRLHVPVKEIFGDNTNSIRLTKEYYQKLRRLATLKGSVNSGKR
ncbi:MAG: helix-turn-helix domain-containing protein [bacterium]